VIVDCAVYTKGVRRPGELHVEDALEAARKDDDSFVWIGLHEPTTAEFDAVANEFRLHPLAVEDAVKAHQRSKMERYGDCLFLVFKTARYDDEQEIIEFSEIQLFAGEGFVITVRHGQASALSPVRRQLEEEPERMALGPAAVVHAILDRVVDDYLPVLDGLDHDIVEIEAQVFSPERTNPAERIYKLKREVLDFNRAAAPLVEPVDRLARGDYEQVHPEVRAYFGDVNDHLIRVHEQLESYRDLLTSILEANLAQVTVRQNQDVRTISAIVAIVAVPTMIAGIYGMNFEHMPELSWTFGYPLVLGVMVCICFGVYRWFKKVGWLQ
jgi:magnesium transporter